MRRRGAVFLLLFCTPAYSTYAGAWPTPAGETQAIFKFEGSDADSGLDASSNKVSIPHLRDDSLSVFTEAGLTSRLTLQAKAGVTEGEDQFVKYSGRGPITLGLRYTVLNGPQGVVSVYVGATYDGVGRNAGYALPNAGNNDLEVRLLAGRSTKLWGQSLFGEVQVARLFRQGLQDETHLDATLGWKPDARWMVLVQSYAGRADPGGSNGPVAPEWAKLEASVVRHLGHWSLQGGWRTTAWGVNVPLESGPVVAVWRRF